MSLRTKSFAIQTSPSHQRFDFQAFAAAIDGIIFTGVDPLLSIHVSIISFFSLRRYCAGHDGPLA